MSKTKYYRISRRWIHMYEAYFKASSEEEKEDITEYFEDNSDGYEQGMDWECDAEVEEIDKAEFEDFVIHSEGFPDVGADFRRREEAND